MDAAEYDNLARVEREHWYYAGKREVVRYWIKRIRSPVATDRLLDCGAGTGLFALEMSDSCQVHVLDSHEESLKILRQRFRPDQVIPMEGENVPLPDASLDYVTALDVLEHVPDDSAVVQGFHRLLKPGGLAIITVPASIALWSDWDVALHHFRRYSRPQLRGLFNPEQWDILYLNYTNVVVYPAVWLVRRWRALLGRRNAIPGGIGRPEDRIPPQWLNSLLRQMFVNMAKWRFPFPVGVSLVLVARRKE